MTKHKVWYEVDPHNRLIIKSPPGKSRVKKFRKIVHGRFKTDNKNRLFYEVSKSSGIDTPQKIGFGGRYSLDKRRNLIFTLNKWGNQCQGNRLRLRTGIVNADAGEIIFVLNSKISEKKRHLYTMNLHGSWHSDKNNRLTFGVKKKNNKRDDLTLFSAWRLNKDNEIIYNCGPDANDITLKGQWRIVDRYRLGYVLHKGINLALNFKTSLGQIVPRAKKTYVKFDVAIDLSKKKRITRKVVFTCTCKLGKHRRIVLEVSPRMRKASLRLTKEILNKKGIAYIESFFKDKERYLGAGLAFRW